MMYSSGENSTQAFLFDVSYIICNEHLVYIVTRDQTMIIILHYIIILYIISI